MIRLAHLELGLPNPLQDNWMLSSLLKGMKRGKQGGDSKAPFTPDHLSKIKETLNLHCMEDRQFWAAALACFFGLLRISSVTVKGEKYWEQNYYLQRSDAKLTSRGMVLCIKLSKTNQFRDRVQETPLPLLSGHRLCPTTALIDFLSQAGELSADLLLLAFSEVRAPSGYKVLTQANFRRRLGKALQEAGLDLVHYNTHSLRRGGATWLLEAGVPVSAIHILGDWKSDSVFKYLCPSVEGKMQLLQSAISKLCV